MYIQKYQKVDSLERQIQLIVQNPLGTIITSGSQGLIANHYPFICDKTEDGFKLRAHLPRASNQNKDLIVQDEQCLIIFQGLDEYISPGFYKDTKPKTGKVVPTWDLSTVHVYGRPRLIDDDNWILQQLNDLTNVHEQPRLEPWKVSDAPEGHTRILRKALVGLEILVTKVEGKWKMSQNLNDIDAEGVIEGLSEQGEKGKLLAEQIQESRRHYYYLDKK
jgi:transcriptional regulator